MDWRRADGSVSGDWVQRQPRSPVAWSTRAAVCNNLGRTAEAITAQRIAGRLSGGHRVGLITQVFDALSSNGLAGGGRALAGGGEGRLRGPRFPGGGGGPHMPGSGPPPPAGGRRPGAPPPP